MLCAKGILTCSKETNLSVYEPGCAAVSPPKAKLWSQKNLAEVALNGCLLAKAKLRSPASRMKTKNVKRPSGTSPGATTMCSSLRSSLGCAGKSGLVAMSPWKREVVKRVKHCPLREENKENSVISTACSSFAVSRAESMSSVASNVSRIGRLGIRGQLKLDITSSSRGTLNIRVSEAKHLKHVGTEKPCFYTQVSLVPEDENLSTYVTRIVPGNQPAFEESFTVAVNDKDKRRRVILSVMQMRAGRSDLIGCMSFGVRHLTNKAKDVSGWFYLLNDELGRRKHLRVVNSTSALPSDDDVSSVAPSHQSRRRGPGSHDRTIRGITYDDTVESGISSQPDHIPFTDACAAHGYLHPGLRPILEEQYDPVEMLRYEDTMHYSGNHRNIDITEMVTSGKSMDSYKSDPYIQTPPGPQNTPMHSLSEFLPSSFYDSTGEFSWQQSRREESNENAHDLQSVEQQCWNIVADLDSNVNDVSTDTYKDLMKDTFMTTFNTTMVGESMISQSCRWQHLQRLFDIEDSYVQRMLQAAERYSRPLRHCILQPKEHGALFQNIEKLIVISQFHVRRLGEACANHQNQDTTLSVEADIGSVYLPQLHLMCEAYQAYCAGLPKAIALLDELMRDSDFNKFVSKPPPATKKDLDIADFIRKPALHMEELLHQFDSMMLDLPLKSQDFDDVKKVLEALQRCLKGVSMQSLRRSVDSGISNGSDATSRRSSMGSRTMSSQASVALMCRTISRGSVATRSSRTSMTTRSTSQVSLLSGSSQASAFSMDPEVAEIQNRLVVPQSVKMFQVAAPNRHVIYSSELYWVDGWKWARVQLTLMNDVILLTRTDQSGDMTAIREPIPLRDVIGWDFDCMHPGEFVLTVDDMNPDADEDEDETPKSLVFRAHRVELKNTWHQLLDQKINACRSQREYSL